MSETEVVVGTHVQRVSRRSREMEMSILVTAGSVDQCDVSTGNSRHWPFKAVIDPKLETANIEVIKIAIQGTVSISWLQMTVILLSKSLAKEIANMPEGN